MMLLNCTCGEKPRHRHRFDGPTETVITWVECKCGHKSVEHHERASELYRAQQHVENLWESQVRRNDGTKSV